MLLGGGGLRAYHIRKEYNKRKEYLLPLYCEGHESSEPTLSLLGRYGTDVSSIALECAERNGALNGLDGRASFLLPYELSMNLRADVTVANMLAGPLVSVAAEVPN